MPRTIDPMTDDFDDFVRFEDVHNRPYRAKRAGLGTVVAATVAGLTALLGLGLWAVSHFMEPYQPPTELSAETLVGHQVKMGMSPETVRQLYPSLALSMANRSGRSGTFQHDGTSHTVWFFTEHGSEQVWRIHFKRAYREMSEDQVLERFVRVHGAPVFESCETPVGGAGHECHLRWLTKAGMALDVFSQSDTSGRLPLTQIAVVATDTQLAARRFGAQIPQAAPTPSAPTPTLAADPLAKSWPAGKPPAARATRPIDQFMGGLKQKR